MEFRVDCYTTETSQSPVRDWLQELRQQIPSLHALAVAGINKLKDRRYHALPLSEHIEGDLFELRVGRKNIARVLYFFRSGRRIILLHGFVKKSPATALTRQGTGVSTHGRFPAEVSR